MKLIKCLAFNITLLAFCVAFFSAEKVEAVALPEIIISEVYYDTVGADNEEEWVELYNTTSTPTDISGFILKDNNKDYIVPAGVILPGQYYTIAKDLDGFNALYGFPPNSSGMTLNLSNNGDFITLFDDSSTELDQVVWGSGSYKNIISHIGVYKGHSLSRIDVLLDSDDCSVDFIDQTFPSPGLGYVPKVYSNDIIINEIVPKPKDGVENEFIELYNFGDEDIDLLGWKIDDIRIDGSKAFEITEEMSADERTIEVGGYILFYKLKTKIALNDSGDSVVLIAPDGSVKDTIIYDKAMKGQSFSRFVDGWKWTLTLSPNEQNIFSQENEEVPAIALPIETISICEARGLNIDENVRVEGVVTVLPGVLSNSSFYIQKDGCGIQVYSYWKKFPLLNTGDRILVEGVMASYFNESRIKISNEEDIVILGSVDPEVPLPIATADCNEDTEGEVVEVVGVVTKTSGSTFWISDGSKEIRVVIRSLTGIKKPKMRKGDRVKIIGVVSQYKDYFRILPYEQSGVIILTSEVLPTAGSGVDAYLILTLVVFSTFVIWNYSQKTKKKLTILPIKLPAN